MKKGLAVVVLGISVLFAACDNTVAPSATWSEAQLANVLDLSELGTLSFTEDGQALIGGKALPVSTDLNIPYSRTYNYLNLSDEVLNTLPIAARDFFLEATPDELRDALGQVGVSVENIHELQAASSEYGLTWEQFDTTVYSVAKSLNKASLFDASRLHAPQLETTAIYDITAKTNLYSYPFDCGPANGSYRVSSTSSTTSNTKSYYLAAKNSLTIGGTLVSDSRLGESYGPISGVSDPTTYYVPCTRTPSTSASGWHKGKYSSGSTAIIKTSKG